MSKEGDRQSVLRTTKVRTALKGDNSWIQRQQQENLEKDEEEKPWVAEVRANRSNGVFEETSPVSSPTANVPQPRSDTEKGVFKKTDSKPTSNSSTNGYAGINSFKKKPSESYKKIAPHTIRSSNEKTVQSEPTLSPEEMEKRTEAASSVLKGSAAYRRSYVMSAAKKYESSEKPDSSAEMGISFVAKRVDIIIQLQPVVKEVKPAAPEIKSEPKPVTETKPTTQTKITTEAIATSEYKTALENTTQPKTASEHKPATETTTVAETKPTAQTKTVTEPKPTTQTTTATDPKPTSEPKAAETKPTTKTEPKPAIETKTETKPATQTTTATEPKPTPEPKPAETKPTTKIEPKPATETKTETKTTTQTTTATESKLVVKTKSTTQTITATDSKPTPELNPAETKPTATEPKPAIETKTVTDTKTETKPTTQTTTATESKLEVETKSTTKIAIASDPKPTSEPKAVELKPTKTAELKPAVETKPTTQTTTLKPAPESKPEPVPEKRFAVLIAEILCGRLWNSHLWISTMSSTTKMLCLPFYSSSDYVSSTTSNYSYSSPSYSSRGDMTPCTYCGEMVGNDAKITIEHLNISCHPSCFKCGICSKPMGDLLYNMFLHRGTVHCESCYSNVL
uniref:Zinc finger protein 185 with LIM domain n=1 Tax=Sinocyclocheilus rhinocerous TaxID=307959 RepID=A0A673KMV6_9TELE